MGGEHGLAAYTFRVPGRGSSIHVNETLTAGKLELQLKEIRRDETDHIVLVFQPMTNYGRLISGRMEGENSLGSGSSSGNEFTLSLGYTCYVMEPDDQTVKETVCRFPYETGDKMTVRVMELKLALDNGGPACLTFAP